MSIKNLLTYPTIKRKVLIKDITIQGWYYNLIDGSIELYDQVNKRYRDINEYK